MNNILPKGTRFKTNRKIEYSFRCISFKKGHKGTIVYKFNELLNNCYLVEFDSYKNKQLLLNVNNMIFAENCVVNNSIKSLKRLI